jgi:hypothetical protein
MFSHALNTSAMNSAAQTAKHLTFISYPFHKSRKLIYKEKPPAELPAGDLLADVFDGFAKDPPSMTHSLLYFPFNAVALTFFVHRAIAGYLTKTFFYSAFDLFGFALQFAFVTHCPQLKYSKVDDTAPSVSVKRRLVYP